MALATYTDLIAAVRDTFVGQLFADADLSRFVTLAEAEINRSLRVREMIRRRVSPVDGAYVTLPGDYLEARNITLLTDPQRTLEAVGLDLADQYRDRGSVPRYYAVSGQQMEILPTPPGGTPDVEMVYYGRLPSVETTETNWLLKTAPDLYLSLALKHAAVFVVADERAQVFAAEAMRLITDLNRAGQMAEFGSAPLRVRTSTYFG